MAWMHSSPEVPSGSDLESVYRSEGLRLQRALLLFAGDADVASEAVAEAFAQALRRGTAIRSPAKWIWRAAFRIAAGELKDRARRARPVASDPEGRYELPDDVIDLVAALRKLSPKQRAAVVLHHLDGYSSVEIARILDSTPPAVFVHLSQGRKRLRHLLEEGDD